MCQVMAEIEAGRHRALMLGSITSWAHRLLYGSKVMRGREERLFIRCVDPATP